MVSKKARRKQNIDNKKLRVFEYLTRNPCFLCGEDDPLVLEFDHIEDKSADVSRLINGEAPWTAVQRELTKCAVLCSNCHKRKTHREANSYRYRLACQRAR